MMGNHLLDFLSQNDGDVVMTFSSGSPFPSLDVKISWAMMESVPPSPLLEAATHSGQMSVPNHWGEGAEQVGIALVSISGMKLLCSVESPRVECHLKSLGLSSQLGNSEDPSSKSPGKEGERERQWRFAKDSSLGYLIPSPISAFFLTSQAIS